MLAHSLSHTGPTSLVWTSNSDPAALTKNACTSSAGFEETVSRFVQSKRKRERERDTERK
jgi:hypothetical protein